jgi:hypothetical protein
VRDIQGACIFTRRRLKVGGKAATEQELGWASSNIYMLLYVSYLCFILGAPVSSASIKRPEVGLFMEPQGNIMHSRDFEGYPQQNREELRGAVLI